MSFPSFYYFTFILLFYFYCFIYFYISFLLKGFFTDLGNAKILQQGEETHQVLDSPYNQERQLIDPLPFIFYIFLFFYFKILKILNFNVIILLFKILN